MKRAGILLALLAASSVVGAVSHDDTLPIRIASGQAVIGGELGAEIGVFAPPGSWTLHVVLGTELGTSSLVIDGRKVQVHVSGNVRVVESVADPQVVWGGMLPIPKDQELVGHDGYVTAVLVSGTGEVVHSVFCVPIGPIVEDALS